MEPRETYPHQPARTDEPHLSQGRSSVMEEGTSSTTAEQLGASAAACPTGPEAQSAQSGTEQLGEKGRATGEQMREKARHAGEQARDQARHTAEQVRDQAAQAVEQARESGQQAVEGQKHRLAHSLHSVGQAVHEAANRLREENNPNLAEYTDQLARQIDDASDYLEHHRLGDLMDEAQHWARRRPELVLGGMFLGGLALARFLKASHPQETPSAERMPTRRAGLPAQQVHAGPPAAGEAQPTPFTPPGEPYATTTEPESVGQSISTSHPK